MKSTLVALAAAAALLFSGCSASIPAQTEANAAEARSTIAELEGVDTLVIKKDFLAIGDHWSVKVDGEEIATIEGLDLPALGDTYSLLSPSGGFMAGEDEDILNLAKTANLYDADKEPTGKLTKKVFSIGAEYKLEDTEGELKARLEQRFGMTFKADLEDAKGKVVWTMKEAALSMGAEITLTRQGDATTVSTTDAILMAVVASEIANTKSN